MDKKKVKRIVEIKCCSLGSKHCVLFYKCSLILQYNQLTDCLINILLIGLLLNVYLSFHLCVLTCQSMRTLEAFRIKYCWKYSHGSPDSLLLVSKKQEKKMHINLFYFLMLYNHLSNKIMFSFFNLWSEEIDDQFNNCIAHIKHIVFYIS